MEIVEKVKEIEKEPTKEYASKGVAGTALGIGIGALALSVLNGRGFGLFGNNWGYSGGMPQNVNINADVNGTNGSMPSTFSVWEKECEDNLKQQADMYNLALSNQYNRFNDRQTLNGELFSVWKSQVDADFG